MLTQPPHPLFPVAALPRASAQPCTEVPEADLCGGRLLFAGLNAPHPRLCCIRGTQCRWSNESVWTCVPLRRAAPAAPSDTLQQQQQQGPARSEEEPKTLPAPRNSQPPDNPQPLQAPPAGATAPPGPGPKGPPLPPPPPPRPLFIAARVVFNVTLTVTMGSRGIRLVLW
jgi:hypothetical protein